MCIRDSTNCAGTRARTVTRTPQNVRTVRCAVVHYNPLLILEIVVTLGTDRNYNMDLQVWTQIIFGLFE